MSSPPTTTDAIRDMEKRLEELAERKEAIEKEHRELTSALAVLRRLYGGAQDRYKGLTKIEAAVRCLKDHGQPMGTAEIVDALLGGGFETESKRQNFYNSLYAKLVDFAEKGEQVKKAGRKWTLLSNELSEADLLREEKGVRQ